jgi:lipid II:glycine glycyltransferase (peptidoglycan interpeptide bridge formation enzyme)
MLAIPRKQRAMVRKGIKNGLKSEIDTHVDRFFALYADNVHRHGTPALPKRYFSPAARVRRRLRGADRHGPDGKPLSSVLSFYFRDEVLPYYAGDDTAARDLAANDFKYWELMRRACARGLRSSTTAAASRAPGPTPSRRTGASSPRRCTTSTACTSATRCRRTTRPTPSTS